MFCIKNIIINKLNKPIFFFKKGSLNKPALDVIKWTLLLNKEKKNPQPPPKAKSLNYLFEKAKAANHCTTIVDVIHNSDRKTFSWCPRHFYTHCNPYTQTIMLYMDNLFFVLKEDT